MLGWVVWTVIVAITWVFAFILSQVIPFFSAFLGQWIRFGFEQVCGGVEQVSNNEQGTDDEHFLVLFLLLSANDAGVEGGTYASLLLCPTMYVRSIAHASSSRLFDPLRSALLGHLSSIRRYFLYVSDAQ